ncbi:MAG: MMPL family transporter [Bacteroidetes bacterium]|nr:MMPL family transporter [Bacteroidota bacterium]
MLRFFLRIYDYFQSRKYLFYVLTVFLFVALALVSSRIRLEEDISAILPEGEKTKEITDILRSSNVADKVIVKIISRREAEPEELIEVADSFERRLLDQFSGQIVSIKSRVSDETALQIYQSVYENLPIFLEEEDYQIIDSLTEPAQISRSLEQNYDLLTSASGMVLKQLIADDPLGISMPVLQRLKKMQVDDHYDLYDGHIMSKDKRSAYLFISLKSGMGETAKNEKLFAGFDRIISSTEKSGVEILYYGNPVVASGNAHQLKQDSILTLSITICCILAFTWFFFRRKRVPFIMMLPVLFGGLFSLAFITLFRGSISSIALGAGSIVLGIAVNYSLHFFTHFRHCGSVKQTIADLFSPITIGSFTTIGSFLSLTLLESRILNDFGWFAGLSLMGAALFSLIFLPQFITADKNTPSGSSYLYSIYLSTEGFVQKNAGLFSLAILLITIFFLQYASNVRFESDLNTVNYMSPKTKYAQKEIDLTQDENSKLVFIASTGKTTEQMLRNSEQLSQQLKNAKQKGLIYDYSTFSDFIPSRKMQEERIKRWNQYWTEARKQRVLEKIKLEAKQFKFQPTAFSNFDSLLIHEQHLNMGEEKLHVIKEAFGNEYLISEPDKEIGLSAVRVDKARRSTLYAQLAQDPANIILDKQIITNKLVNIIAGDFNRILLFTSSLVFISLLFTYGRLELTVITFLPMVITWIWILGIMGWLGLQFNLINIIISTFIFGLGDDFGIFMTDGLVQKYREGKEVLSSHKTSIFLSAVTILIGLGALIFAQHPALRSIAMISIIGIFCVVFIGQTLQPVLFNFVAQNRKISGRAPWTFITLALTAFSYTYFTFSALLLTIFGFALFYIVPFIPLKKKKLFFHYLIHASLKSLLYVMVNVKKRHINKESMDFSKPAVIIVNHTSVLDILVTVAQHPKLILLTNRWVYYSPVFGKVVQMADYLPTMEGVNPALDKFEKIVKEGYSIVIFPEGTRSVDGKIKRFHKGAFYLAEKLNLDIVPLVIHGGADSLRKGDFMIFNGQLTMKYLPRIKANDLSFGSNYIQRAKNITSYFRTEYRKLQVEIERPRWFRQRLAMNYIYKGLELEWQALKLAQREDLYATLNDVVPKAGMITELGCGYGLTTYMLHFLGVKRQIVGVDSDEERVRVAK